MAKIKAIIRLETVEAHAADKNNPHGVTAEQVGAYGRHEVYAKAEVYSREEVYPKNAVYNKVEIDNLLTGEAEVVGGLSNREIITVSRNWVSPRTMTALFLLVSAGGPGRGGNSAGYSGGGGGSGALALALISLEQGQTVNLAIGAPSGISSGGSTSIVVNGFGYTVTGGSPGEKGTGPSAYGTGGAPGSVIGAALLFLGRVNSGTAGGAGTGGTGGAGFDVYGDGSALFGNGGAGFIGTSPAYNLGTQGCVVIIY